MVSEDFLAADDQFIACKPIFLEMLMFRDLRDTVGLIALKCFQLAGSVKAVTDTPALPSVLERALSRVRMAPFMKFEEACALSDELERVVTLGAVPGFAEISRALVEAANEPATSHEHD
jgi:hypothetical protein